MKPKSYLDLFSFMSLQAVSGKFVLFFIATHCVLKQKVIACDNHNSLSKVYFILERYLRLHSGFQIILFKKFAK